VRRAQQVRSHHARAPGQLQSKKIGKPPFKMLAEVGCAIALDSD